MRFFLLILCFGLPALAVENQSTPLFAISKEVNNNTVHYEAQMTPDCRLDPKNPIHVFWVLGNHTHTKLNWIEKGLYGADIDKINNKDPYTVQFQVKAFKNRNIDLPIEVVSKKTLDGCTAEAKTNGGNEIQSIKLSDFHGSNPKKVSVLEVDPNGIAKNSTFAF